MKKHALVNVLKMTEVGVELTVHGWVRTLRDAKNHAFIALNDGSCLSSLQVFVDKSTFNEVETLKNVATGCALEVTGVLVASPGQGQALELHAQNITVVGGSPEDYPLQKKRHTMEFLRDIAHLRGRTNSIGAVMRVRHATSFAIHQFFNNNGFTYIHTPIITSSDAEGAGEMFQVTTLPLDKLQGDVDYSRDFFGKKTHLTVSGQLAVESYAMALGNVYTFGPTFRAENSNTTRHLAEFWMVEPEMAFCNIEGLVGVSEHFLKHLISYLMENCAEDLAFFNEHLRPGLLTDLNNALAGSFKRITYTQAVAELEKAISGGHKFEYPISWGLDMKSEHERYLTEELHKAPLIVTDYPKEIKSFYMKLNDDGKTVRGMDILMPGIGEIIGGSEREENYDVLHARMVECGLNPDDYAWYLDLRKYGSAPHAGFGLGLERFLLWITGMGNIRDVIPFPRAPRLCDF